MQTNRTLSRRALTVQDMTVDSAKQPILPPVATPRCDLRPTPGTALQPTKRRERFRCIFEHIRGRPTNALRGLVRTSVSRTSICPYGYIRMDRVYRLMAARLSSPCPRAGAFRRER
jgi:hypothetical protein